MQQNEERSLLTEIKPELFLHNSPELNAEAPAHLLDPDITPLGLLFVRNNGSQPVFSDDEVRSWTLTIDGCVKAYATFTLQDLRDRFDAVTETAVMECAGNGRAYFNPPASSPPWRQGAVGCLRWTGVRLADLLAQCGLLPNAVYTGHYSPDRNREGTADAISRGIPIAKALAPETLVAYAINGEPIPAIHGGPLRIVAPGFPGSAWQKWLTRIAIRDREHDGEKMTKLFYRLPRKPVQPGGPFDESMFDVITDMPVKSMITFPQDGFEAPAGQPLHVRGHAWSGHIDLAGVAVSFNGGQSWQDAAPGPAAGRFAWRRFEATLPYPTAGALEIIARAADVKGNRQPLQSAPWNPRGYCNNTVHRIRGKIL